MAPTFQRNWPFDASKSAKFSKGARRARSALRALGRAYGAQEKALGILLAPWCSKVVKKYVYGPKYGWCNGWDVRYTGVTPLVLGKNVTLQPAAERME